MKIFYYSTVILDYGWIGHDDIQDIYEPNLTYN